MQGSKRHSGTGTRWLAAALALLATALFPSAPVHAASGYCYTIVDARNQIVVQGPDAPIDLSRPVAPQVAREYPGGHLIVAADVTDCPRVHLPGGQARRTLNLSPQSVELREAARNPTRP